MVTIATFGEPLEANLARGYLESLGIPSFLANEQTVGTAPHLMIAIGGIKLEVADEIETEARTALAERRSVTAEAENPTTDPMALPGDTLRYESRSDGDEAEIEPTHREQNAERAWRCTIVCFFFPPLALYIFWLLIQVWSSDEHLGPKARRHALLAALINIPVVMATIYWLRSFLPV